MEVMTKTEKYSRSLNYIILTLVVLMYPIGDAARFVELPGMGERSPAILLILFFSIISFVSLRAENTVRPIRIVNYASLFFVIYIVSVYLNHSDDRGLYSTVVFSGYYVFFIAILISQLGSYDIMRVLISCVIMASLVYTLSILDYMHVLDIETFNKDMSAVEVLGDSKMIMTSLFGSRTRYINSLSITFACALGLFFVTNGRLKALMALSMLLHVVAGMMSFSRGFVLVVATLVVLIFISELFHKEKRHFLVFLAGLLLLVVAALLFFSPLGTIGDMLRINALLYLYERDLVSFLIGNGPEKPMIEQFGRMGMHTTIGTVLNEAGYLGALFFLMVTAPVILYAAKVRQDPQRYYLALPVAAWLIFGVFHNNLHSSFAWMLMGLMYLQISLMNQQPREAKT